MMYPMGEKYVIRGRNILPMDIKRVILTKKGVLNMMRKSATMFRGMLAKFLVLAMVLSLVGINTTTAEAAAKPALSKTTGSVLVGKKLDLDVKNQVKGSTYTWKSSNTKIATVDKNGVITGKVKGTVTITCKVKTSKVTYQLASKVTVKTGATSVAVSNKVTALNEGQTYTLKTTLKPSASNDLVSFTSSNAKVLKVDTKGKLTAVKAGKATVTAKTLSGKSVKVAVTVVDKAGTVTTQKELDSLLGSGAALVTLKTAAAGEFKIAAGKYSTQSLVVDAPNADVINSGVFKAIEIKAIKASTWTEQAAGNSIQVTAPNARVIVATGGSAVITVGAGAGTIELVNNGTVGSLNLVAPATVNISGTTTTPINVVASAANASVTSSVPLAVQSSAQFALKLLPGAEKSTVKATTEAAVPTITGNVKLVVTIGTGDNATTKEVTGDSYTGGAVVGGGSSGGPTTVSGSYTITAGADGKFILPASFTSIKEVKVQYGPLGLDVDSTTLTDLKAFLADVDGSYDKWLATTHTVKTYSSQKVLVEGEAGMNHKTVTFEDGLIGDRVYDVTVEEDGDITVNKQGSSISYTINKQQDTVLQISGAPSTLSFVVTY